MEIDGFAAPTIDAETRGCLRLWAAVMHNGLLSAAVGLKRQDTTHEGARWFLSDDDRPGSFVWICDLMGIDADQARSKARMRFRELLRKEDEKRKRLAAEDGITLAEETPESADGLPKRNKKVKSAGAVSDVLVCVGVDT